MRYIYMIYMYLYKTYTLDPLHMHMLHSCCSTFSTFSILGVAMARLMASRLLVAGRVLDFEDESCSICIAELCCTSA